MCEWDWNEEFLVVMTRELKAYKYAPWFTARLVVKLFRELDLMDQSKVEMKQECE